MKSDDTDSELKNIPSKTNYINFIPEIKEWFDNRIKLEGSRKKGRQTTAFTNKIKSSGAEKQRMLDNIIYPSLFNLIAFFKCIQNDHHMKKLFQKDFIKLVGMNEMRNIKAIKSKREQLHSFRYKGNNFSGLVLAMANSVEPKLGQKNLDVKILYAFLYQVQDIIGRIASISMEKKYGTESFFSIDAKNTFLKSIDLLAGLAIDYDDKLDYDDLSN